MEQLSSDLLNLLFLFVKRNASPDILDIGDTAVVNNGDDLIEKIDPII